jgi:adenylate cyclase
MVRWCSVLSLVMNPGLPGEQHFALARGATVSIGRTKDNAIFCLHKSLSRKHAQVEFDGVKVKITDLQSKNGIFANGKRVTRCELREGDSFRCGEVTFNVERSTPRTPRVTSAELQGRAVKTLPSPLASSPPSSRQRPAVTPDQPVTVGAEQRYKDKLFLLIRASELCVSETRIDNVLDELVELAVQVLTVDRIALLTLDESTLEMKPRIVKTFVAPGQSQYSLRVVNWVVDNGSPASFMDVSRDRTLPGDAKRDAGVRGAMCVPINPGGGTIGVIYADSLSRTDCFRPDDLALLRALANLAAVAIEGDNLRNSSNERQTIVGR